MFVKPQVCHVHAIDIAVNYFAATLPDTKKADFFLIGNPPFSPEVTDDIVVDYRRQGGSDIFDDYAHRIFQIAQPQIKSTPLRFLCRYVLYQLLAAELYLSCKDVTNLTNPQKLAYASHVLLEVIRRVIDGYVKIYHIFHFVEKEIRYQISVPAAANIAYNCRDA